MTSIILEDIKTVCLDCGLICTTDIKRCPVCNFKMSKTFNSARHIEDNVLSIMLGLK